MAGLVLVAGLMILAASLTAIVVARPAPDRSRRELTSGRPVMRVPSPPLALRGATPIPPAVAARPPGQPVHVPDRPVPGQRLTLEQASALAVHLAETDPLRVVEVIGQWMREDSDEQGSGSST